MKHYKDPSTNEIYAYEADGSQDEFIKEGLVSITDAEANALRVANQAAHEATLGYAERRRMEYPAIGDQLDALFHAGVFPAEMAALIQAIKDKYPKG
jgi:hypothetical protein